MKRFNPIEFGINIYGEPIDSQQPIPQNYGISYKLIEEYEKRIEQIDMEYSVFYAPANEIAKLTFAILVIVAIIYTFSGNGHSVTFLLFPVLLIPSACILNWYLKKRNYENRNKAMLQVRSEIIERFLQDFYTWYNNKFDSRLRYYDIIGEDQ